MVNIVYVDSGYRLNHIRKLFTEYVENLGFDLYFQEYQKEYESLPGEYSKPEGRLYLAYYNNRVAGCVALRKIDGQICEMKRLYVRSQFRGKKLGALLSKKIIDDARDIGYTTMRLDTVPSMKAAIALYRSLGFEEIKPYRYNPMEGAVFMELRL